MFNTLFMAIDSILPLLQLIVNILGKIFLLKTKPIIKILAHFEMNLLFILD